MSYMFHRYELYSGKEPQNIGFIAGLDRISLPDDKKRILLERFTKELPCPPPELFKNLKSMGQEAKAWFTLKGIEYFKEEISLLRRAYRNTGFHIVETKSNCLYRVVYADEYQVLINFPIC